ncbi:hypothetical protein HID58_079254, partial [Brassica napus]
LLVFSGFLFFFLLSTTGPRQHALPHHSSGDSPPIRVSGDSRATPPPTKPPGDLLPPPPHSVAVSCPPSPSIFSPFSIRSGRLYLCTFIRDDLLMKSVTTKSLRPESPFTASNPSHRVTSSATIVITLHGDSLLL